MDLSVKKINFKIIYHYPCIDGAYSCFLFQKWINQIKQKQNKHLIESTYHPIKSNQSINEILIDKNENESEIIVLFIIDKGLSTYDYEYLKSLLKFNYLYIIDHHIISVNSIKQADMSSVIYNDYNTLTYNLYRIFNENTTKDTNSFLNICLSEDNKQSSCLLIFNLLSLYNNKYFLGESFLNNNDVKIMYSISDDDTGNYEIDDSKYIKGGLCEK